MRIDQGGMSLWFGTTDAPAPADVVSDGSSLAATIAVQPPDASNRVEVLYSINGGTQQMLPASWFRTDPVRKVHYFRAQFPPLRPGDKVEYSAICRCAGRQIPSAAEGAQLTSSFRVAERPSAGAEEGSPRRSVDVPLRTGGSPKAGEKSTTTRHRSAQPQEVNGATSKAKPAVGAPRETSVAIVGAKGARTQSSVAAAGMRVASPSIPVSPPAGGKSAWQSLANSLSTLPRVLAGPVLRKVAPRSVSVWLAMRVGGDVTLNVLDALNAPLASGHRHTVAVGTQLHIVCVTAVPSAGAPDLVEGVMYRYNLAFAFDDQQSMDLPTATGTQTLPGAFAYVPFGLPSFCLPPASLDDLRLLCGSCRIPHGNGRDAFPVADKLIKQASSNPLARPHQLLLTGDQIYADDVAASLLMVLSDASHVLLGWKEEVPIDDKGGKASVDKLLPFLRRQPLEDAGFTSEDLDGHLMSLGEYLCMYLMVWSDVLWPAEMPTFNDAAKAAGVFLGGDPIELGHWLGQRVKKNHDGAMAKEAPKLALFRQDLQDVRRLLANIPSYMILDDHEVTDDWNMTRDTCKALYGHPLGLRVVQNALVAYALCQHWGNVPEVFEDAGAGVAKPPGKALLDLLDNTTDASRYEANSPALRTLVSVHDEATLATRPANALFHDEGSLLYNFTVEGPGHQIIFTDSRSWRSFPTGTVGGGVLMPTEQLAQQIVATPPTGDRILIVVMTTNAPAVEPIRSAARHDFIANHFAHYPDVYEAWEMPSIHFDRLMVSLTEKLPLVDGRRTGALALVSGDVHFSFATRLLYKATTRLEDVRPQPIKAVIAQLVASSFRKETDNTLGFHRDGYNFAPNFIAWLLIPKTMPQGYAGWNTTLGSAKAVGQRGIAVGNTFVPLYTVTLDQPTLPTAPDGLFLGTAIDPQTPPDYSYRLDYLTPPEVTVPVDTQPIPPLPAGATPDERKMAAESLRLAATKYRMYNAGGAVNKVIGTNNFCEITFDWHPTNVSLRRLHHTVRWRKDQDSDLQLSDYVVSLDPDDPGFAELVPRAVP